MIRELGLGLKGEECVYDLLRGVLTVVGDRADSSQVTRLLAYRVQSLMLQT